jgi:UDP-N-acetylmuramate dehydrogenase
LSSKLPIYDCELMESEKPEIQQNVALAPLTTLGVGGIARFFVRAESVSDVEAAVAFTRERRLPLFVLGGGSNLLVSDQGWAGLVLRIGVLGIEERHEKSKTVFQVGAGVEWDDFVAHCVARTCGGIECLSGIPGSVGGTPVQNVGAYGQEVSETIVSVLTFDLEENRVRELTAAECGFSYRGSIFNGSQRGRYIILRVTYNLACDIKPSLGYADLQKHFVGRDGTPSLNEVRDAVLAIRASKGMLLTAGDPDSRSAGSFFKNPVLSAAQHEELVRRAEERGLDVPSYPALSQQRKVSAAWLVENSGFKKGYVQGKAGISSKHALAIVNLGEATAADIVALKDEIQAGVELAWGLHLEPEPVFVGF